MEFTRCRLQGTAVPRHTAAEAKPHDQIDAILSGHEVSPIPIPWPCRAETPTLEEKNPLLPCQPGYLLPENGNRHD